jgi:hypothetical protein
VGECLQGIVVFALSGEDAGSLLDRAKFVCPSNTFLADEVLAVGNDGTGLVIEIGFAVVPEVSDNTGTEPLVGSEGESGLQVGLGGGAILVSNQSAGPGDGDEADVGKGPLREILLAELFEEIGVLALGEKVFHADGLGDGSHRNARER